MGCRHPRRALVGRLPGDDERNAKSSPADSGASVGGNDRGADTVGLTTDEWLNIWAFGVSPYGLGLSEGRLWTMTPREFIALKRVWAVREAAFHNAHFRPADDVPFLPEDFISPAARVERKAKMLRDKADVMMEQQKIDKMHAGEADGVPIMFREIGRVN